MTESTSATTLAIAAEELAAARTMAFHTCHPGATYEHRQRVAALARLDAAIDAYVEAQDAECPEARAADPVVAPPRVRYPTRARA